MEDDELNVEDTGTFCGYVHEHEGHLFFKPEEGMVEERFCNGFEPRFNSHPEPDEVFEWEDDDYEYEVSL